MTTPSYSDWEHGDSVVLVGRIVKTRDSHERIYMLNVSSKVSKNKNEQTQNYSSHWNTWINEAWIINKSWRKHMEMPSPNACLLKCCTRSRHHSFIRSIAITGCIAVELSLWGRRNGVSVSALPTPPLASFFGNKRNWTNLFQCLFREKEDPICHNMMRHRPWTCSD